MSESMSSPWIRDYLVDVAETYGAQLYNTPAATAKKKVQLTDFLTYQQDSYVWAWISDKDHRVSVRISKDAVDKYKSLHGRDIIDCRFSLVFISSYRPMFSPRPLGPNVTGNTPVSHMSLEIGHVKSVGIGGHLFGNPRDLESDKHMKEWVLGLRQDGGGGNVLKLRKQQELAQNKEASLSPPSPPPFSLYAPVSQHQTTKVAEPAAKPKPERPQDLKRAYAKRWRVVEANSWKFAMKPAAEKRPNQTESSHPLVEPRLDITSRLESCHRGPLVCLTSPHRTPSPTSRLQRQGTPTDWSLSNKGSPVAPDEAITITFGNGIRQHDEPEFLPTTPHSDTEGHSIMDTDTRSPQPPTPAQRIKPPPPRSTSPPRSSPEVFTRSSPLDKVQEKASPAPVPRHDSEAWKEPSFLAKNKGKGKARAGNELMDTPSVKVGQKRRRSAQPESPVPKRAKVSPPEVRWMASGQTTTEIMQPRDIEASANGKIHSNNRPSTSPMDTTEMTTPSTAFQLSKPRLANLVVDFERIDLGKRVPIPMVDMDNDIKSMLLRTGRIRTLGKKVEKDGNAYIMIR